MDLLRWVRESRTKIEENGWVGLQQSLRPVYRKIIEQGRRFQPVGDNIYDYDWDLLIVVDACRLDLMKEVNPKYNFLQTVNSHWSLDSTTALWMERTFRNRTTDNTTYICSNPFSEEYLSEENFAHLHEIWRSVWEEPGTVPPRPITDYAVNRMRKQQTPRTIVHYLQPHCPFIPKPNLSNGKKLGKFGNQDNRDVWELLRDGEISQEELWDGYRQNLELVLDDIQILLNNVSADKVVITSDHGNALGKWGIYGHPPRMPHNSLREVPWIETTAEDLNEYVPRIENETNDSIGREEQLEALGYA